MCVPLYVLCVRKAGALLLPDDIPDKLPYTMTNSKGGTRLTMREMLLDAEESLHADHASNMFYWACRQLKEDMPGYNMDILHKAPTYTEMVSKKELRQEKLKKIAEEQKKRDLLNPGGVKEVKREGGGRLAAMQAPQAD